METENPQDPQTPQTPQPANPNIDMSALNTEQKLELLKLLEAKRFNETDRTIQTYDPSIIQEAYLCCKAKIRLLTGANRAGKSDVGALDVQIRATGIIPDSIKEQYPVEMIRPNGLYWASSLTFTASRDISLPKILKFCPKKEYNSFNKEDKKLFLKNGTIIQLKSADQGREKYQGVSCFGEWFDEEHPEDIYDEGYMRTTDCGGWVTLTFTPVEGLTWAYQKLFKKAKYYVTSVNIHGLKEDIGVVHAPEEIPKLKERKLVVVPNTSEEADDDIVVFQMTIYDNKHLPDVEIWRAEKKHKDDPSKYNARILGCFTKLTGRNVFSYEHLLKMQRKVPTKFHRGDIVNGQFKPALKGRLIIFTEKIKKDNGCYIIGADVAEGSDEGDYSTAQILDRRTCEQVAVWHGHASPDEFASILYNIGEFFNYAYLAPERNFHGYGVVNSLRNKKYKRLYYSRDVGQEAIRKDHTGSKTYGWDTNSRTKPIMIQTLASYIRDGHIRLNDINTIDELITYNYDKDGQTGAIGGCFDDRVIALAIALQLYEDTPITSMSSVQDVYKSKPKISDITGY